MKRLYTLLLCAIVALVLFSSCHREGADRIGDEGIVLRIKCTENETKGDTYHGIVDWNENRLDVIDVFFYQEDNLDGNAVLHNRFTPGESDGDAIVTTYTTDAFVYGMLIPVESTFYVYVIANYPEEIVTNEGNLSNTSIARLKSLALTLPSVQELSANHKLNNFVMDGLAHITDVHPDKRLIATGEVSLKRVAAKLSVELNIADRIEVEKKVTFDDTEGERTYTEVWEPLTGSLVLYMENGVSNTTLAGKPVDNPTYFDYPELRATKSLAAENSEYPWLSDPMYVYPQRWVYSSKESPTIEPSLKLKLPWIRVGDTPFPDHPEFTVTTKEKQFYYKVILPDDEREDTEDETYLRHLVRNNWYKFKIDVGIFGSETEDATVDLDGSYYVLDWKTQAVVVRHASIGKSRYLSLEPKVFTLYNEPDLAMLFSSSHPVALTKGKNDPTLDITVTKAYYGTEAANASVSGGTVKVAGASHPDYDNGQKYIEYNASQRAARNGGQEWLTISGNHIVLNHELDNNPSSSYFDTSPYIIRFNLYHSDHHDDAVYKQSVKITQYPAIYIIREQSNGVVYVNNQCFVDDGNNNPSSNVTDSQGTNIGSIVRPGNVDGNGDNNNQNFYNVYVTVLPSDSENMIGDPRTDGSSAIVTTLNNLNDDANYRPVADNTRKIIAPSIKIASSYGKTGTTWYENVQARCAAYQESGYPAGRWRLPTNAEIQYLVTLSSNGVIPTLFSPGPSTSQLKDSAGNKHDYYSYYWSNGGYAYDGSSFTYLLDMKKLDGTGTPNYTFNNQSYYSSSLVNGYNLHSCYVRCVYDIWYWGEEPDKSHLTDWGGYQTTK